MPCPGAFLRIEQPVIRAEILVEPQGMVEARGMTSGSDTLLPCTTMELSSSDISEA